MTDGSNPVGTVEQSAPVDDADALLDRALGPDDAEDEEQPPSDDVDASAATDEEGATQEEDDAPSQDGEQSTDAGRFVADNAKVRLPDGTVTTVAELKQGSLRQADYTRKTQEVSASRKELEARQAEIAQKSQSFEQTINFALQVAQASMPQEPSREMLASDPIAYLQQKAEYDARLGQLQHLSAAKQQHEEVKSGEQQRAFHEWVSGERQRLVEAMPELKDTAKLHAFNGELVKGIEQYGFTAQDLSNVYDHRLVLLAKDALAYQKLKASKPQAMAKTQGKPAFTPGRRQSPNGEKQRSNAGDWQKVRASHGQDHAALDRILDKFI